MTSLYCSKYFIYFPHPYNHSCVIHLLVLKYRYKFIPNGAFKFTTFEVGHGSRTCDEKIEN